MRHFKCAGKVISGILFFGGMGFAGAQTPAAPAPTVLTVVDEDGAAVPGAQVVAEEPGQSQIRFTTDYAGHGTYLLKGSQPYLLRIAKPGFYETVVPQADALIREIRVALNHEQMVLEQVSVTASAPGIDTEEIPDKSTMNMPEIINVPYTTSRDIRNLLPFYPGVVQDASGQAHVDGSETWATLDLLDGFDIRSPMSGILALRVSADAVRSIDKEATRYPVEYGRSTGGVVAFYTGMGDNTFRFNATDFIPSYQANNGIHFDKFVPRITFSGPLVRNRSWFFDGVEAEYDNIYISGLPSGANSDQLIRGSNLIKFQANATPSNILSGGLLFNVYHSPYDGMSTLVPQASTTDRNTIAWLPYLRDQHSFRDGTLGGALLDVGLGVVRISDGYEPRGNIPFQITPELSLGSYFENETGHSQRIEGNAALYLPPQHWAGEHDLKAGIDVDHISFGESVTRAAVEYLREDGTLLRRITFPATAPFTRHNMEAGAYLQDRWTPRAGLLVEPGMRFDWDEIIRSPLFSPRLAATYSPAAAKGRTKFSAGIGLYYEHTQLEYLARALAGIRDDTCYTDCVAIPVGQSSTNFSAIYGSLHEARALNWSAGVEQRLPGSVYLKANYLHKRVTDEFTYVDQNTPLSSSQNYVLTNGRRDSDYSAEIEARRTFAGGYTLFAAYTHSSAQTNAAIDYVPTLSMLGPQQSGPLGWDTPNRVLSWGWLPVPAPQLKKRWDFVYTVDWHTGFPYTPVDDNSQVVGAAGSQRFPNYLSFSPGLEWRFHFRRYYFGLRGVIENMTDNGNYLVVNNVVDSPQYGSLSEFYGRVFTARLRLISQKK
jgi:TonB dependent receptor